MNRVLKFTPKVTSHFKDVPKTNSFAMDIAAICEAGIISGFQDHTFRPNEYLTRSEMAVIVQRAFKLNQDLAKVASTYSDINDKHWAYHATLTMKNIDKTGTFAGEKFYGTQRASRAVFSAAIYNAMNVK
ncbi:MAG TPA: S-layer homology domain-containing protein [Pseudobacillus sp.]